MSWLRRLMGIHNEEEIRQAVEQEPTVKEARKQLARADAILVRELQRVERGPRRARMDRRAGDPH